MTRLSITSKLSLAIILCAATQVVPAAERTGAAKPNFVYIMADELGYFELSCMGHPHIRTPNIDRMAEEGIRFTQFLAGSSLCAPTRAVLMTGKHSGHTSVRTNGGGTPLRADEATIASVLKEQGYATGGFGKWGCGGRGSTGVPEKHGFDEFVGYYDQVHAHSYYPKYILRNSEELPLKDNHGMSRGATYSHYVIVDRAREFIRKHKDQPFFCYLPITPPHGLFDIPETDPSWRLYKDKPWPEQARKYAAMVSMVDRQVGEIIALLRELSLEKNTLVVFCGDNGGNDYFADPKHKRGFHAPNVNPKNGDEFRGRKGRLYEGGLRIPAIARWPGKIRPGRVSDHLCYFPDVMPTLSELAGAKTPADSDGISFVAELLGPDVAGRRQQEHEYLYWELGAQTAVRAGHWKAVRPGRNAAWELYDLTKDISEKNNVAADAPEQLSKMQAWARAAHTPPREGVFHDRTLHERDRLAKFGGRRPARGNRRRMRANRLDRKGLIPAAEMKLLRFSSQAPGKEATRAFDGNPRTWWHSQFGTELKKHPHELVIDLGKSRTIAGVRYLARQDNGWNGAIADCEFAVSDDPQALDTVAGKTTFEKKKTSQEYLFSAKGRYLLVRLRSEINGGPWGSIAEIGVIGK